MRPGERGKGGGERERQTETERGVRQSCHVVHKHKVYGHEWAGDVAHMWEKGNAYRILMGKRERTRPLGRTRHKWEDNIKTDLLNRRKGFD